VIKKNHWLKLDRNFFKRHDVSIIREMPEGDGIVLFYMMLLAESIDHDGYLRVNEYIPYDADTLSIITKTPRSTVELAVPLLRKFGLLEILSDDTYYLTKLESMLGKTDNSSERVAKYRDKQKQLKEGEKDVTVTVTNVTVAELEKEKELELDKEIYSTVISYLNEKAGTNYRASSSKTKQLIRARTNDGFIDTDFIKVIDNKVNDWLNDKKMKQFLRPETLFGTKFEGYLNQGTTAKAEVINLPFIEED